MSHATTTIGRVQVHRRPAIDAERPGERAVGEDFEPVVIDAVASSAERVTTR